MTSILSKSVDVFTSKCSGQQEVSAIFLDQVLSDHLGAGPAAKQAGIPDELGRQR